jgi:hypothetical protein
MADPIDVWEIRRRPDFVAFQAERNRGVPRIRSHPLQFPWNRRPRVMCGSVVAEGRDDQLWLGAILSDKSEFWREWQGSFSALLLEEVEHGWTLAKNATRGWFGQWLAENSPEGVRQLTYHDSSLGALWTDAVGISGRCITIDEC